MGKAKRTHKEPSGLFTCDTRHLNGCVGFTLLWSFGDQF